MIAFGGRWVDVAADLRYAVRYFARTPLATITIVLTLGLGIGFSSATFSVLSGIFMRPAPGVPDDPALVKIRGKSSEAPFARKLSYVEVSAYAGLTGTFASVAAWKTSGVVVDAGPGNLAPVTGSAQFVTPNYFSTLGIRPAGRGFGQSRPDELYTPELTAVVSDAFAAELFGDARAAVGKEVKVNEVAVTIVGVAPPRFNGAQQSGETRRLWMPLSSLLLVEKTSPTVFANPDLHWYEAFARLQPGVTPEEALPVVRGVAARVDADAKARAPQGTRRSIATADVVRLRGVIDPARYASERGPVAVMFSVLAIIILLVCTTTVNSLLVGSAVARRYEVGVRLAMGASRSRIVRQLLTEVAILSLAGGALGMWVFGVLGKLTEVAQDGFDVSPNWGTTGFTILYALVTATIAGLSPALHATRTGLSEILKDSSMGATRKSRLQRTFVVAQIAIAQPLMVVLAAAIANILTEIPRLRDVALRERLMLAEFDTRLRYTVNAPDRIPALVQRLTELPGVVSVLPVGEGWRHLVLEPPTAAGGGDAPPINVSAYHVPVGYFAAVEAPIVAGREFVASDTMPGTTTPVVINRQLASQLFKDGNPIGQRIRERRAAADSAPEMEVVGVVDIAQQNNTLDYPSELPPLFAPYRRRGGGRLLIRTSGPAEPMMQTVLSLAREEARLSPLYKIGTLAQADRKRRTSRLKIFGTGTGVAMLVLTLASVGLYAMLSSAVGQRRREIGVRMAMGAHARDVVMMFFRNGLRVTLLGLAIGLPLSLAGLAILTYNTTLSWVHMPRSAVLVTLAVIGVGSLASWLPARRAATVDPMLALRSE